MNDEEKYLFDLNGFLVLPQVLSPEEVRRGNEAIDRHADQMQEIDRSLARESSALKGSSRRLDLGGMLAWERPWCELFRDLLLHPGVRPYLEGILGEGYRLDHGPGLIAMNAGCEGGVLHGGGVRAQLLGGLLLQGRPHLHRADRGRVPVRRRRPGGRRRGGDSRKPQVEPALPAAE